MGGWIRDDKGKVFLNSILIFELKFIFKSMSMKICIQSIKNYFQLEGSNPKITIKIFALCIARNVLQFSS